MDCEEEQSTSGGNFSIPPTEAKRVRKLQKQREQREKAKAEEAFIKEKIVKLPPVYLGYDTGASERKWTISTVQEALQYKEMADTQLSVSIPTKRVEHPNEHGREPQIFLEQAYNHLDEEDEERKDLIHASEKFWLCADRAIQLVTRSRGLKIKDHQAKRQFVYFLGENFFDETEAQILGDKYELLENLRSNYYENTFELERVDRGFAHCKEFIKLLNQFHRGGHTFDMGSFFEMCEGEGLIKDKEQNEEENVFVWKKKKGMQFPWNVREQK